MFFARFIGALLSAVSLVTAYGAPGACSGTCTVHDPALIRRSSDGTFFRFSTGNRIQIATAPALSGPWTVKGSALPSGSSINLAGNQDLWAPESAPNRANLLPLLRCLDLRFPILGHRRRYIFHHGCRLVDRPRERRCHQ